MTTEIAGLDQFRGAKPAAAFAALNPADESLSDGIGSSYAVIGYKGKQWSLRYRGEKHLFLRPDDGEPMSFIDVIILRQARNKAKSYYPEGFNEGGSDGKRPLCASMDGVKPDSDAQVPQSQMCQLCPHNVWGVDPQGRKHKDCTDYKRLAVLLLPTLTAPLLGAPLLEPAFLRIPPASLQPLSVFGDTMASQGWHFTTFVTRISFVPTKSHPEFVFRPIQKLTDAEAGMVMGLREDHNAKRITGEIVFAAPALPAPNVVQMIAPNVVQMIAPAGSNPTGLTAPVSIPQLQVQSRPQPAMIEAQATTVNTGLVTGLASIGSPAVHQPQPQNININTAVDDTGTPSDDEMDRKIAQLMARV